MKFGLSDKTVQRIKEVFAKHPQVQRVILYGSRAKGNYRNGSDIDLTLFGNELSFKLQLKIDTELDDLLLPYSFDISIFSQISNLDLIEHINRVGKVFYVQEGFFENESFH